MSKKAFHVAACLAKQSNCKLMVMHIKESDAKSLALQTDYETLALKERVEIKFFARPRKLASVHEAVVELAEELQVDFLYMGAFGADSSGILNILGSTAEWCLTACTASLVLVKSTAFELEDQRTFVIPVDSSDASAAAFAFVQQKLMKPRDILHVVTISRGKGTGGLGILGKYKDKMSAMPLDEASRTTSLDSQGENVAETIAAHCKQVQADFCVIGISGFMKEKLGSVSDTVVRQARCTVMVVKDPREVSIQRAKGR